MMLRAHKILVLLVLGSLVLPLPVTAQQPGKLYRLAFVNAPSRLPPLGRANVEAFQRVLRDLGWVEGKSYSLELRLAESEEKLPDLAAQVVWEKFDLILVGMTPAAIAVKAVTTTTPIVMTAACDPVDCGVVRSLARPGGNVTGSTIITADIAGKRIELLKEIVPRLTRVAAIPHGPESFCATAAWLSHSEAMARALGVRFQRTRLDPLISVDSDAAFAALKKDGVGAITVMEGPPSIVATPQIVAGAAKYGLATVFPLREQVRAGGLVSYGVNLTAMWQRAAYFVDRILRGASPAELPVEQPTTFNLAVNLKTARALGLTIPPAVLVLADEVVE